jgi:ribosomal protein S18 acetylase RimI-like enzyme
MKRVPGRNLFFQPELDNGNIVIVTPRGEPVGSIWWRPTGKYTVEIEHLEIGSAYQNTGLGEALLREFTANLQTLYPEAHFLTANATSQGIVRLLRKVFGPERDRANLFDLPRRSPKDWISTRNRVHLRFRAKPRESVTARQLAGHLLEHA